MLQNANRSKLIDSRIIEPLKFNDKVIKNQKLDDEINKNNTSGIFSTPNQSPQSEHIPSNNTHLSFNNSRIINSSMIMSGLKFKDSPNVEQTENQKQKKSVMDFINIHTEEIIKDTEGQANHNLMRYKTSVLKPKDSLVFKGKQSYIGSPEVHTPLTSSPN